MHHEEAWLMIKGSPRTEYFDEAMSVVKRLSVEFLRPWQHVVSKV
jgi:hypothetical protein